ncbi:MAG: hypothetical protein K6A94_08250 [Bacteroidales bacterium]|nr:hypothetical protein [Bacteroidales bacterium]
MTHGFDDQGRRWRFSVGLPKLIIWGQEATRREL